VVAELEAEFNEQVFAIKSQKEGLTKIQKALYAVIKIAEPENDNARYTQADIDKYIENLNTELTAEQGETESLEHAAERAQKLLEAWQAGEINAADVQAALAELRESELQNLKDQVDAAKAALDAAIAYLETLE
jgi:DNA repair exonuclease SbcCD ATPase subunit